MVSFTVSSVILVLTTLTTAFPQPITRSTDQFTLSLSAPNQPSLKLVAVQLEALGNLGLYFQDAPGTPAYLNDTYLDFIHPDSRQPTSVYGMNTRLDEVLTHTTFTFPVTARLYQEGGLSGYGVGEGGVITAYQMYPDTGFYACTNYVDSVQVLELSWGSLVESPVDCFAIDLVQNFDV